MTKNNSYLYYGLSYTGVPSISKVKRSLFCLRIFFLVQNLKIQPPTSSDLNDLKNNSAKYFENSLKSLHIFQELISIHRWWASNFIQISPLRFENLTTLFNKLVLVLKSHSLLARRETKWLWDWVKNTAFWVWVQLEEKFSHKFEVVKDKQDNIDHYINYW